MNLPFEASLNNKEPSVAADSGIILWRKNFSYFIIFFAIPFWTAAFLLRLLAGNLWYLPWLILWYLKPLFDRTILQVISVRFFAPNADIKQISRGLFKNLFRSLPGDLLWRRFSPLRAVFTPMRVLENARPAGASKNKAERKKLLTKGGAGYCFPLSVWGLSLEAALLAGEILFIAVMSQIIGNGYLGFEDDFFSKNEIFFFALWCFNYILVESMYVCMGFGVYINSRIEVEGWDLEILFKNFAGKTGFAEKLKKKQTAVSSIGVLLIFILISVFAPATAFTEDTYVQYEDAPVEVLEEILSSPDFGSTRNSWRIALKNPPKERDDLPQIDRSRFYKLIDILENIAASGLRLVLIILAIAFAIVLFIFVRKYIKSKKIIEYKPTASILQDIPQKSPHELLDKAVFYYKLANLRLSWGYITAALILSLQLFYGIVFPPNATENDCARIIKGRQDIEPAVREQICALIKIWINFAYAGYLPPDGKFDEAVTVCRTLLDQASNKVDGSNE